MKANGSRLYFIAGNTRATDQRESAAESGQAADQRGKTISPYCAFSSRMNFSRASSVGMSLEQAWLATSMAAEALPLSSASGRLFPAIRL